METLNPLWLVVGEGILVGGFIWWDLREMSRRFERKARDRTKRLHHYEDPTKLRRDMRSQANPSI